MELTFIIRGILISFVRRHWWSEREGKHKRTTIVTNE